MMLPPSLTPNMFLLQSLFTIRYNFPRSKRIVLPIEVLDLRSCSCMRIKAKEASYVAGGKRRCCSQYVRR